MKKFFLAILFAVVFTVSTSAQVVAMQNLKEKIGIGFNTTWEHVPVFACRYWLTDDTGVEGFTGFRINNENKYYDFEDYFVLGGKLLRIIKSYNNLNVIASTTFSVNCQNKSKSTSCMHPDKSYLAFLVSFGLEWFVLDNLSLSADADFRLTVGDSRIRFATYPEISIKFYL
ncbi:MAG: hypothetical protein LBQ13_02275 [Endomicrobium sp.]|jgi:opacity protein-like surface antigen|nr:hypothetical protein [Endomicrobium sp.]